MKLQQPLAVVTPTLDGTVLAVLARTETAFTAGQIARLVVDASTDGIRKALNRLATEGTVDIERAGNAYLYRLNRDHLAAEPIIALARQRDTLLDRLSQAMQRWSPPPTYAAVFGSAARGEMRSDSDIDLFLVRPDSPGADWDEQVSDLAIGASRWTGNDVRPLVLTRADIDTGAAPTDVGTVEPVLAEIVRDAITVIGSPTWLSRRIAAARGSHA